ncbi:MAG: hypothetical protein KGM17_01675 [Sphingomonadales bacterium]|nr:hypothetical protein [Sphingomonadales bacterium]
MSDLSDDCQSLEESAIELESRRREMYRALAAKLCSASADPESVDFGAVFRLSQKVLERTDLDMSRMFKVSRPTISRWTRGITAPHPVMRRAMFDLLQAQLRERLKTGR